MTSELLEKGAVLRPNRPLKQVACTACGAHVSSYDRFMAALLSRTPSIAEVAFCAGGKEVVEPVRGIEAALSGHSERLHVCAGITEAHLHVRCRHCGNAWLMATRDGGRR